MLRQQLQETKETLAARDAEVQELKTRVAELEKLQQQQQQLLTMKDSELAAAQQNLAKTKPGRGGSTPRRRSNAVPASPEPAGRAPIWLWGGIALIAMALLGWWLSSRRRSIPPAPAPVRYRGAGRQRADDRGGCRRWHRRSPTMAFTPCRTSKATKTP